MRLLHFKIPPPHTHTHKRKKTCKPPITLLLGYPIFNKTKQIIIVFEMFQILMTRVVRIISLR